MCLVLLSNYTVDIFVFVFVFFYLPSGYHMLIEHKAFMTLKMSYTVSSYRQEHILNVVKNFPLHHQTVRL